MEGIIDKENERAAGSLPCWTTWRKKWNVLPVTTVLPSTGNGS